MRKPLGAVACLAALSLIVLAFLYRDGQGKAPDTMTSVSESEPSSRPSAPPAKKVVTEDDTPPAPLPPNWEQSPSTLFLQIKVSWSAARYVSSWVKPQLSYRRPRGKGPFEAVATDARGQSFRLPFSARGLVPRGVILKPGATSFAAGDQVYHTETPVVLKLPGSLQMPIRVQIRDSSDELGSFVIGANKPPWLKDQ